jgi:hypothetical protein
MNGKHTRRFFGALAVATVVAAALGPSAGAWVPSVEADEPIASSQAIVLVPDAAERAVKRQAQQKLQATVVGPDAFERAVRRARR